MLFYLNDSLLVGKEHPNYIKIRDAVRNLASSAVQGKHLVLADQNVLEHLEDWFVGDESIWRYFHRLIANYAITGTPTAITYKIEVVFSENLETPLTSNQMDYSAFLDFDAVSQCSLIAENEYDCIFYQYILTWYLASFHKAENLRTLLSNVNGSGGETPLAIVKELDKQHVSICIVDTDIRYPGDSINADSTCAKCRRVNKITPYYKYIELNVHEVENLIPINYILQVDGWNGDARDRKVAFEKICRNSRIMRFFDIKKGVPRSDLKNDDLYNFGKLCYESNPDYINACSFEEKYASGTPCIYPPLIKNALKNLVKIISTGGLADPPEFLDFQENYWKLIGATLLNYGVAYNAESVY